MKLPGSLKLVLLLARETEQKTYLKTKIKV